MDDVNESILLTIKKMLGGACSSDNSFDTDLIVHINTAFAILNHIGVGKENFIISSDEEKWIDFFETEDELSFFVMIKSWVYFKVKKMFDAPQSSALKEANDQMLDEIEWRVHSKANYERTKNE